MAKSGRTEEGLFGTLYHYDGNGKKIGKSEPGIFGGYTNYDAKGHKVGHSNPDIFGGYKHYDNKGQKIGHSDPGIFGDYNHYDANGKKTGHSNPGLLTGYTHTSTGTSGKSSSSEGCYVATCVYGSYDCPEVWTLRRFRDNILRKNLLGKAFVKTYYAVSPTAVKLFGNTTLFKNFFKPKLDKLVKKLNKSGVDSTPYYDR